VLDLTEEPHVIIAENARSAASSKAVSRDPLVNVASDLGATVRTVSEKEDRHE
jgi:hypothetical protein